MTNREKVIKAFETEIMNFTPAYTSDELLKEVMETALELLKTMEVVVKCKDCICCIPYNDRWRLPSKPDGLWCRLFDKEVEKEWYCHEGQGW